MFQFLIGTLKTEIAGYDLRENMDVSIPHRYAKNEEKTTEERPCNCGFQFLIGTLKTIGMNERGKEATGFQFLIGTLKTLYAVCGVGYFWRFNSS